MGNFLPFEYKKTCKMANFVLFYTNVISGGAKSWVFLHVGWGGVHVNLLLSFTPHVWP